MNRFNKIVSLFALVAVLAAAAFAQETASAPKTAPQEKSVTVFGAKIRYLEAGDASRPTVILLHGLGAQAESWQLSFAALAARYRIIAPDQVGFGKSDKPMLKYRVGTFVDFLDKFMSELKIERAHLVGNSMGGWVSALTAIKYPNRVEKIVLVDAAGLIPDALDTKSIYQLNNSTRDEVRANLQLIFASPALRNNELLVDQFMTQRVAAGDGYTIDSLIESILRREDTLNGRLGEIKKPTLVVWGREDRLVPLADGEALQKGIAGARLVVIDNCGHVPQFEKPVEFTAAVLKFLAGEE